MAGAPQWLIYKEGYDTWKLYIKTSDNEIMMTFIGANTKMEKKKLKGSYDYLYRITDGKTIGNVATTPSNMKGISVKYKAADDDVAPQIFFSLPDDIYVSLIGYIEGGILKEYSYNGFVNRPVNGENTDPMAGNYNSENDDDDPRPLSGGRRRKVRKTRRVASKKSRKHRK
jgi:hypothetical protein